MKLPWMVLIFILLCISEEAHSSPAPSRDQNTEKTVKVRLLIRESLAKIKVDALDLKVYQLDSTRKKWVRKSWITKEAATQFDCRKGIVSWVLPSGKKTLSQAPLHLKPMPGFMTVNGKRVRDGLRLYPGERGCQIIQVVSIENYLDGVVGSEFSPAWSFEAVKAQVIAARTYAYFQMKKARFEGRRYDLKTTVADQVYIGTRSEDFRSARAVQATRGKILVDEKSKKAVKAFYHSTCGGLTENPKAVWGENYRGIAGGVSCPFCHGSPAKRWKKELPQEELLVAMKKNAGRSKPDSWPGDWYTRIRKGELINLAISGLTDTGRVKRVDTYWQTKKGKLKLELTSNQFRNWIGTQKIKSTRFSVGKMESSRTQSRFFVKGVGFGHGVGLCQWGAKRMAETGKNSQQILTHYYPKAKITKLW